MFIWDYFGLFLLLPIGALVVRYGKALHKHEHFVYTVTLTLSLVLSTFVLLNVRVSQWWGIYDLFYSGHLSFALFTLVMAPGVFKHKSKPKIAFMRVRRELAVLGFISLFPHALLRLSLALSGYNTTGLIAFLIIIPLIITSIPTLRKKMHPRTWKRIHYAAYGVYFMIYVHLAFNVFFVGFNTTIRIKPTGWPYIIIFVLYLFVKLSRTVSHVRRRKQKAAQ